MRFRALTAALDEAIAEGVFPGAAVAWGDQDSFETLFRGQLSSAADAPDVDDRTLYDLASLTKVMVTAFVAQKLEGEGTLALDARIFSCFSGIGSVDPLREHITPRHLLAHSAGYPAGRPYQERTLDAIEARRLIMEEPVETVPGTRTLYSDIGFLVLGFLLEEVGGGDLDELCGGAVRFRPSEEDWERCAPTDLVEDWRREMWRLRRRVEQPAVEIDGRDYLRGEVHDPRAALLGGVAGHAGAFGTLGEVARFAQDRLRAWLGGDRTWTEPACLGGARGLGWDLDPGEARDVCGDGVFGHTGFTGTMLWIDPSRHRFLVHLSNRVHTSASLDAIKGTRARLIRLAFGNGS